MFTLTDGVHGTEQVCNIRRQYVPLYIKCLQEDQMGGNEEIRQYDSQLDEATILFFRRLAHTQVIRCNMVLFDGDGVGSMSLCTLRNCLVEHLSSVLCSTHARCNGTRRRQQLRPLHRPNRAVGAGLGG